MKNHALYKRIRITGASGAGKTYLGKQIAQLTGIPLTSVDTLRYDFSQTHRFDTKIPLEQSKKMLAQLLKKKKWIVEGSFYTYSKEAFDQADIIIYLHPVLLKRLYHTLKRFFYRIKIGRYEGLYNFLDLTWYNITSYKKWSKVRPPLFRSRYKNKVKFFSSADEALEWFNQEIV